MDLDNLGFWLFLAAAALSCAICHAADEHNQSETMKACISRNPPEVCTKEFQRP